MYWLIESCCCCISLEAGTQLISILSTLFSLLTGALYGSAAGLLNISETRRLVYTAMAVVSAVQCLFGILLIIGAFRRKPCLMWPWLAAAWSSGAGLLLISVAGSILLLLEQSLTEDAYVIISAYVLYSLILLYCAAVVNSRRVELAKDRQESESARALVARYPTAWRYA